MGVGLLQTAYRAINIDDMLKTGLNGEFEMGR